MSEIFLIITLSSKISIIRIYFWITKFVLRRLSPQKLVILRGKKKVIKIKVTVIIAHSIWAIIRERRRQRLR